jgi:hypothetical protein
LKTKILFGLFLSICVLFFSFASAQTITGAWRGKIKNIRLELKLIRTGDSLTGTSYYYKSKDNFRRFTVKGHFDPLTNQVIWWDDVLLVDRAPGIFVGSNEPDALLSTADFNCPGEDVMLLDGSSTLRDDKENKKGIIHLEKTGLPLFKDEWDFVIENYTIGANDPYIIDSISHIALSTVPAVVPSHTPVMVKSPPSPTRPIRRVGQQPLPAEAKRPAATVLTIEDKFVTRTKKLATVIPITGDSIELRFYDNAEIDGDSIALFLNNTLVFKNIRLTDKAYTIKFATASLQNDNELVMVAENLGSIPPNTSLMVVLVGDKRYEARLQSTENSSALIRFLKQGTTP